MPYSEYSREAKVFRYLGGGGEFQFGIINYPVPYPVESLQQYPASIQEQQQESSC